MASRVGGVPQAVVYAAWLQALDRPEEGIKTLEKMLAQAGESPDESAAEAADVLAMLYLARGEKDKAKKAVEFGLKVLGYRDVKHGYVLALLRGRLKSDVAAGEAEKLYHDAERLRADEKFLEAGKVYARVRAMCPTKLPSPSGRGAGGEGVSPENPDARWGHAAGFRIGQCYLGLNRPTEALAWWQAFVKESPAGPWRGQARAALVDLALEFQLDLKAATEHALAAAAVLEKELDADAAPSWHAAAYDIYLRQGIVSLVDHRYEAALQGFEQAKQHLPSPSGRKARHDLPSPSGRGVGGEGVGPGLDRLIAAARDHLKLLPDEVMSGDDRATTALVLGSIYSLLQEPEIAKGWFSMPLGGATRSRSPAHRSFAGFGLVRAMLATRQAKSSALLQAKALLEASLTEYPKGSWHDETLYRLATMIEDAAEAKFGKPSKPAGEGKSTETHRRPQGPDSDFATERERNIALVKAKSEALQRWQQLIRRYPESPRCEQAFYRAGVLLYETAETMSPGKADQTAEEADTLFQRLCVKFPKSLYLIDAAVRRIDYALERKFDLPHAASVVAQGLDLAKNQNVQIETGADGSLTRRSLDEAAKAISDGSEKLPEWSQSTTKPPADLLHDLYHLHLRAGVVAYLAEDYDRAVKYLESAGPARPTDGMEGNFDPEKVGVHLLLACSRRKEPTWYPEAVNAAKGDAQKLALRLADTYQHAKRPERAEAIYRRLLAGESPFGRPNKAVESYCWMQLAGLFARQGLRYETSVEYYGRFYQKDYAEVPWAATAILRLAVLEYNKTQDARSAIRRYQYILGRYPNHPDAERTLYFLATNASRLGDRSLTASTCRTFLERYPKSGWRGHVQALLSEVEAKTQKPEKEPER